MKRRILVVDDETECAEMVKLRIEADGYEVATACNAMEGLQKAQILNPRLILLDVNMPGMDGFQMLNKLRQTPGTRFIPVVMLTARGETKSIFKAQGCGATDYLIKPCDPDTLIEVVRKHAGAD